MVAADAMVETRVSSNTTMPADPIPSDWYEGSVGPLAVHDWSDLNSREAIVTLSPSLRELK